MRAASTGQQCRACLHEKLYELAAPLYCGLEHLLVAVMLLDQAYEASKSLAGSPCLPKEVVHSKAVCSSGVRGFQRLLHQDRHLLHKRGEAHPATSQPVTLPPHLWLPYCTFAAAASQKVLDKAQEGTVGTRVWPWARRPAVWILPRQHNTSSNVESGR